MTNREVDYVRTGRDAIPIISMRGTAHECGVQYGSAARELIAYTVDAYLDSFRRRHGLGADEIFELARDRKSVV